jgi:DNA-binding protein H-NS
MRKQDLAAMRFDDLWQLYEQLAEVLADKLTAEKRELEGRLAKLNPIDPVSEDGAGPPPSLPLTDRASRRKYPKVLPKYSNPLVPAQKWSGRGKTPRWVTAALAAGQRLDDLRIEQVQKRNRDERPQGGRTTPAVR